MDNSNLTSSKEPHFIFFGSPSKLVYLSPIKAVINGFDEHNFINQTNNQSISSTLKFRFPQNFLGKSYENLVLPCVSASEIFNKIFDIELPFNDLEKTDILYNSMIKISNDYHGTDLIEAFQSGKRSAIVKWKDNKYYRLKGCGNLNEGFPLEKMKFPKNAIDIRGCQFRHTAIRELYMTYKINSIIENYGFLCANKPIGFWIYNQNEILEKSLKNELNLIDKCCSVYRVIGEKRLGCHLMPGLEIILAEISKCKSSTLDPKDIHLFFQNSRIKLNQDNYTILRTSDVTEYVELKEGETINDLFEKYNIYKEDTLTDLYRLYYDSIICRNNSISNTVDGNIIFILKSIFNDRSIFSIFQNKFSESDLLLLIQKFVDNLKLQNFSFLELLGLIYSRLGYECGKIKRIFQDNNINWGTYEDQPYRIHGNAHADNFVIIPKDTEGNKDKNLLSPLDFDLAFFKENFINIRIDMDPEKYGQFDDHLFDTYLNVERQYLEWELAGMENFIIEEIYKDDLNKDKQFKFWFDFFISLLRDTLVSNYRKGYLKKQYSYSKIYEENYNLIHELINIALIISHGILG